MVEDDHYIANPKNAHIDTSEFEARVRALLAGSEGDEAAIESIYDLFAERTNLAPDQPTDCQLICRYLSPENFWHFLHTRSISFPSATQFSDSRECRVPEDYENAVLKVLHSRGLSAGSWSKLVARKAAGWNVSCWTQLEDYFDDHLMWDSYAGGAQGIGITVRYGILKNCLVTAARAIAIDGELYAGCVSYDSLRVLPFNKHRMFRNDKEARFAFQAFEPGAHTVSVDKIFSSFGVRISPAATSGHNESVRRLWLSFGGEDRVQWPQ